MFAVVFVRRDQQPDEVYYHTTEESAKYHISLFSNDDSELYSEIRMEQFADKICRI